MAVPKNDPEWDAKRQEAQELIAAGGCSALSFWNRTDAERLCPKQHLEEVAFEPLEGMMYAYDYISAGKRAIALIQRGIDIFERKKTDSTAQ